MLNIMGLKIVSHNIDKDTATYPLNFLILRLAYLCKAIAARVSLPFCDSVCVLQSASFRIGRGSMTVPG